MPNTQLKRIIIILTAVVIFSVSLAFFTSVFVRGTSIAMANYYPDNGETYASVDHFVDQATAVNTNTTVSVSINGETPIPMAYHGLIHEQVSGDTEARDWYTWQVTVPAITDPGTYTFQFFRHYYVWQTGDQRWAEFNSYSDVQSFNIADSSASPSPSPSPAPSSSPSPSPSPQPAPAEPPYLLAAIVASAVTFLLLALFVVRGRVQRCS